jgi:hypothetical protein
MVPNVSEVALTRPYVGPSDCVSNHTGPSDDVDFVDGGNCDETAKENLQLKWERIMGQKYKIVVSISSTSWRSDTYATGHLIDLTREYFKGEVSLYC